MIHSGEVITNMSAPQCQSWQVRLFHEYDSIKKAAELPVYFYRCELKNALTIAGKLLYDEVVLKKY